MPLVFSCGIFHLFIIREIILCKCLPVLIGSVHLAIAGVDIEITDLGVALFIVVVELDVVACFSNGILCEILVTVGNLESSVTCGKLIHERVLGSIE